MNSFHNFNNITNIRYVCVYVCAATAERSGAKQVDDWLCPTPYPQTPTSTRRRSGTAAVDRPATGQRHRSTADEVTSAVDRLSDGDDVDSLTMDLLLITLGVLLALLIVVGLASYCRAVRS